MFKFIFSFSYLDKKQVIGLKKYLEVNTNDQLHFLTRSNFNDFFDIKFLELKKILTGKYLLIEVENLSDNSNESNIDFLEKKLDFFLNTLKEQNLNLFFFCVVGEDQFYFKNFIIDSKRYNHKYLFDFISKKNSLHKSYFFMLQLRIYFLYFFRINNLYSIYNKNNYLYSYYY